MPDSFFDEQSEQSQVKAKIVADYFGQWSKVMISTQKKFGGDRIAYLDLFAGPGRYEDGGASTPLLILQQAIDDGDLRERLVATFNDKDEGSIGKLESALAALNGIERLRHKPVLMVHEVGEELVQLFESYEKVPTLFFVDPWGYKGLSLRLINSVLRDWGCECIFFFNYNRINMGVDNRIVKEHMDALFGEERGDSLRDRIRGMTPDEREVMILEEICQALEAIRKPLLA